MTTQDKIKYSIKLNNLNDNERKSLALILHTRIQEMKKEKIDFNINKIARTSKAEPIILSTNIEFALSLSIIEVPAKNVATKTYQTVSIKPATIPINIRSEEVILGSIN